MTYAALQDLVERAGETEILEIADRDGDGVADPDVVSAALATAEETINAYLGAVYKLPLSSTPAVVLAWAVSIARYFLHRFERPQNVIDDYKDAIAQLKDAAAGRLAVPDAEGLTPDASPIGATRAEGSCPVFTKRNLEGFL